MTTATREYSSPLRKLVICFKGSRDRWKAKYFQVRITVDNLRGNLRDVTASREKWKSVAQQALAELEEVRRELDAIKNQ